MFRFTYVDDHCLDDCFRMKETNEIKDIIDIAIGVFDDPLIESKIGNISAWMNWGDKFITEDYTIECYKE